MSGQRLAQGRRRPQGPGRGAGLQDRRLQQRALGSAATWPAEQPRAAAHGGAGAVLQEPTACASAWRLASPRHAARLVVFLGTLRLALARLAVRLASLGLYARPGALLASPSLSPLLSMSSPPWSRRPPFRLRRLTRRTPRRTPRASPLASPRPPPPLRLASAFASLLCPRLSSPRLPFSSPLRLRASPRRSARLSVRRRWPSVSSPASPLRAPRLLHLSSLWPLSRRPPQGARRPPPTCLSLPCCVAQPRLGPSAPHWSHLQLHQLSPSASHTHGGRRQAPVRSVLLVAG